MNKEDILKLSREENQSGDEREEKIKLRSYAISSAIGALLCMLLVTLEELIFDRSATPIWIIYSGIIFSKCFVDAIKLKKKYDILLSILTALVFILNVILYVLDSIG